MLSSSTAMNLFRRKKQAPSAASVQPMLASSIAQLRDTQESLERREFQISKQIDVCRAEAQEKLRRKDKRGALLLLKRSKLYDKQIEQLWGKRTNLDVQVMTMESANLNAEVFRTMKTSSETLKALYKSLNVDDVADAMEDLNEGLADNDEINDALAQPMGPTIDEDDLERELAEMEREFVDKQLLAAPALPVSTATASPSAPVKENIVLAVSLPQ